MTIPDTPSVTIPRHDVAATDCLGPAEANRLRWRCRRGMLENDLILTRFLDARGARVTPAEVEALDRLLALSDDSLWDLLCGRAEPEDATLAPLLAVLRSM